MYVAYGRGWELIHATGVFVLKVAHKGTSRVVA